MPKGPAQQFASDYADRIAEHFNGALLIAVPRTTLQAYLETAFHAGVNHAAARFMEGEDPAELTAEGAAVYALHGKNPILRELLKSLGIDCICIKGDPDAEPQRHGNACPVFKNHAERERLDAMMDQVAREAIAAVNESYGEDLERKQTRFLVVLTDGWWTITDDRKGWEMRAACIPVSRYEFKGQLADALRAAVHA